MVEHIVLLKVKPNTPEEAVAVMLAGLRSLKDQIPGIVSLTCGVNTSERGGGHTHGLVVRFESQAALDAYLPHPSHQSLVHEKILPIVDGVIVCDYEISD